MQNFIFVFVLIFYLIRSPTVEESKLPDLRGPFSSPPPLVRTKTVAHPMPQALEPMIEYKEGDVTIKVTRTPTHHQPVEDILDDLPDSIKEIVSSVLGR